MKHLIATAILIFSNSSYAQFSQYFCSTEIPTTSFSIQKNEGLMDVQVLHHNGIKYMPIHDGLITINDLSHFVELSGLLLKLPNYWLFSWPLEKCEFKSRFVFSCMGGAPQYDLNGLKVEPFAVYSSASTEETVFGVFETIKLSVYLVIEGKTQIVTMSYQKMDCAVDGIKAR